MTVKQQKAINEFNDAGISSQEYVNLINDLFMHYSTSDDFVSLPKLTRWTNAEMCRNIRLLIEGVVEMDSHSGE